ncbi:hypothetical protein [Rhodococcoides fascians]|uniref:hypothetical protein n=1 Tax=Rhodococcoides fascians TaxID=1828 RepID=UPI0012D35AB0|nr:hypothetical protein [Rhodococcus fascians]
MNYNPGPITGWQQFSENHANAVTRSLEVRAMYVEDRITLIRSQINHILQLCRDGINCSDEVAS